MTSQVLSFKKNKRVKNPLSRMTFSISMSLMLKVISRFSFVRMNTSMFWKSTTKSIISMWVKILIEHSESTLPSVSMFSCLIDFSGQSS